MNTYKTKQLVEELNVVPLKADKTGQAPEVDQILVELGNQSKGIPYYAIFPGDGSDPITFGGIVSQQKVLESLQQAQPSSSTDARRTAMN